MINPLKFDDFPSNRLTVLQKLQRLGLVRLTAIDCVRCAAGKVWITSEGGTDSVLQEGQSVRIPAKARSVWLTALSEAMVIVTVDSRVQATVAGRHRVPMLAPDRN